MQKIFNKIKNKFNIQAKIDEEKCKIRNKFFALFSVLILESVIDFRSLN